jgi:hypothetical protein
VNQEGQLPPASPRPRGGVAPPSVSWNQRDRRGEEIEHRSHGSPILRIAAGTSTRRIACFLVYLVVWSIYSTQERSSFGRPLRVAARWGAEASTPSLRRTGPQDTPAAPF